jgi:hypothetical protein
MKRRNARRIIVLEGLRLEGLEQLAPPYVLEPPVRWEELETVVRSAPPSAVLLLDPSWRMEPWPLATGTRRCLCLSERAGEASRARSESDVLVLADRVVSAAQRRDQAELEGVAVVGLRRVGQGAGEQLAEDLIASLMRGHADAA